MAGWPPATRCHRATPPEDPAVDTERSDEYDPEVYIINGTLHDMITAADQAPGVVVEARDEEEEEEEEEEGE